MTPTTLRVAPPAATPVIKKGKLKSSFTGVTMGQAAPAIQGVTIAPLVTGIK